MFERAVDFHGMEEENVMDHIDDIEEAGLSVFGSVTAETKGGLMAGQDDVQLESPTGLSDD